MTKLLTTESAKPDRNEKQSLLDCIGSVVSTFDTQLGKLKRGASSSFAQQIIAGVSSVGPTAQKRKFIPVCLWLGGIVSEPQKAQIRSILNTFFAGATPDDLRFVFDKLETDQQRRNGE